MPKLKYKKHVIKHRRNLSGRKHTIVNKNFIDNTKFEPIQYLGNLGADAKEDISEVYHNIAIELRAKGINSRLMKSGFNYFMEVEHDKINEAKRIIAQYVPDCMLYWKEPDTAVSLSDLREMKLKTTEI